jgi:hypothetical protein
MTDAEFQDITAKILGLVLAKMETQGRPTIGKNCDPVWGNRLDPWGVIVEWGAPEGFDWEDLTRADFPRIFEYFHPDAQRLMGHPKGEAFLRQLTWPIRWDWAWDSAGALNDAGRRAFRRLSA